MGDRLARTCFADEVVVVLWRESADWVAMGFEVRVDIVLVEAKCTALGKAMRSVSGSRCLRVGDEVAQRAPRRRR